MASVADATSVADVNVEQTAHSAPVQEAAQATGEAEATDNVVTAAQPPRFTGTPRTMVAGVAMLLSSVMAFTMGLTDVFFAEATAWTFAIWGGLLIYAGMLDIFRVYEVTGDALIIKDDLRPWDRLKIWDWKRINRLDIKVKKNNAKPTDMEMQVYFNPPGEIAQEREDRIYDAELARLIIEHAGLKPAGRGNPTDLTKVPAGSKETFTWNK